MSNTLQDALDDLIFPTTFVVKCCGCTDCFPHAAFVELDKAKEWAKLHCNNPEGYIIKHCYTLEQFIDEWLDD